MVKFSEKDAPKHGRPPDAAVTKPTTQWDFVIPGKPVGKQRPRLSRGKTYTPQETVDYEDLVTVSAMLVKPPSPFPYCAVHIVVRIPVRWQRRKRECDLMHEPLKRSDLDNIAKSILDALQGIAYKDDKHVMSISIRWQFIKGDGKPCVEVMLTKVDWTDYIEGKSYKSAPRPRARGAKEHR